MKFKEIKPGMTIYCPKKKNAKKLLKHLKKLGYTLYGEEKFIQNEHYWLTGRMCYAIEKDMTVICADIGYFKDRWHEITEFSDIVWREPSAEEVLKFLRDHYEDEKYEEAFGNDYTFSELSRKFSAEEIIYKIKIWMEKENKSRETEISTRSKVEEKMNTGMAITLCEQLREALKMAREALEKTVPAEPNAEDCCPVCGCCLMDDDRLWAQYCPDCGQKINLEGRDMKTAEGETR